MDAHQSEVARLRAQIEAEYSAAYQALTGFSETARHKFISARMDRIGEIQGQLAGLLGEEDSMRILCEVFEGDLTAD